MSQPKVSFHLNTLKESGLIRDRKEGRWTHYRLAETDIFRRFLLLSVFEKIPKEAVMEDRERLHAFLLGKNADGNLVSIRTKKRCCGGTNA
jgi:ArsR family transcriptional regulator